MANSNWAIQNFLNIFFSDMFDPLLVEPVDVGHAESWLHMVEWLYTDLEPVQGRSTWVTA